MLRKMKLSTRLLAAFLLVGLIPFSVIGIAALLNSSDALSNQSFAQLEAIREIGVSRLSLGIENFNDDILRENGRAHLSKEIHLSECVIGSTFFGKRN